MSSATIAKSIDRTIFTEFGINDDSALKKNSTSRRMPRNKRAMTQLDVLMRFRSGHRLTVAEIVSLTGWSPSTVPVILSQTFKGEMGLPIMSAKRRVTGEREYFFSARLA